MKYTYEFVKAYIIFYYNKNVYMFLCYSRTRPGEYCERIPTNMIYKYQCIMVMSKYIIL